MGAFFVTASSQCLRNDAPTVIAMPFTVGMWILISSSTTTTVWSLTASANTTNGYRIDVGGVPVSATAISYGSATGSANAGGGTQGLSGTAGRWGLLVARFINASSRRVSSVNNLSEISHGTNATASTVTGVNQMFIGARGGSAPASFWGGNISEWWITNTDIQPDGGQLSDQTLRQLARCGPFSIPHIASAIVEYRSFKNCIESDEEAGLDYFPGPKGRQTWVNVNGVIRGQPNQMLNEGIYRRPGDYTIPGIV